MERDSLRGSLGAIVHGEIDSFGDERCHRDRWNHCRTSLENKSPLAEADFNNLSSPLKPAVVQVRSNRRRWATYSAWITTAIVLLGLGFGLRSLLELGGGPKSRPNLVAAAPGQSGPITLELSRQSPELWLQVSNAISRLSVPDSRVVALVGVERENSAPEILPIIQSKTLAQQVLTLPKPQVPQTYLDQVHRAGWQFDSSRQFLSLHLPNGQNQVLPVDTLNYRFVGNEVF